MFYRAPIGKEKRRRWACCEKATSLEPTAPERSRTAMPLKEYAIVDSKAKAIPLKCIKEHWKYTCLAFVDSSDPLKDLSET